MTLFWTCFWKKKKKTIKAAGPVGTLLQIASYLDIWLTHWWASFEHQFGHWMEKDPFQLFSHFRAFLSKSDMSCPDTWTKMNNSHISFFFFFCSRKCIWHITLCNSHKSFSVSGSRFGYYLKWLVISGKRVLLFFFFFTKKLSRNNDTDSSFCCLLLPLDLHL